MDKIVSGKTYVLKSVQCQTVIDLSKGDNETIFAWQPLNTANQKWKINKVGEKWTFENVGTAGIFLSFWGNSASGVQLKGSKTAVEWVIVPDKDNNTRYRVYNNGWVIDVAAGAKDNGTPVQLWIDRAHNYDNQLWEITEA
ncbi:ricin B lectin domain-containing protein [Crepidotus variabilis]|uniref:Ricin B lectin domain-containing protein n=1 Tax=Crepidotus variabilis TaxID=179855 RepID=A0A9P6EPW5_9AGAR|nr:ricin B lectin domain-containing protein [Crepidotus variabilis]